MSEIAKTEVTKLNVTESKDIAEFYGIPQSLVNMMWCDFNGVAYPKESFVLNRAANKGYQSMELVALKDGPEEFEFECRIYPLITSRTMEALSRITDANERDRYWQYLTKPTTDRGRASRASVRMSAMHMWLREMAVKRAVSRACRLYSGFGNTVYEELPDAVISEEEAAEARKRVLNAKPAWKTAAVDARLG